MGLEQAMQAMGGQITVESELGAGTTFHVYFPCAPEEPARPLSPEPATRPGTECILVVEDEPAIQELVSFTCTSNGYSVRRAPPRRKGR